MMTERIKLVLMDENGIEIPWYRVRWKGLNYDWSDREIGRAMMRGSEPERGDTSSDDLLKQVK